jgi:hypothetical protein
LDLKNTNYGTIAGKVGGSHAEVFGVLILVGNVTLAMRSNLNKFKERLRFRGKRPDIRDDSAAGILVSVSEISPHATMMRFSGESMEGVYTFLVSILQPLNDYMYGLDAYRDRIAVRDGDTKVEKRVKSF